MDKYFVTKCITVSSYKLLIMKKRIVSFGLEK